VFLGLFSSTLLLFTLDFVIIHDCRGVAQLGLAHLRRFKSSRPDQITGVPSQQSLLIHSENTISTSEIPFSPDREFLLPFCFQPGDVLGGETQGVRTQHGLQGFGEVFGGATQFN